MVSFQHLCPSFIARILLLSAFAVVSASGFAEEGSPKDRVQGSTADGFQLSLFDGQSLDGWIVENGARAEVQDKTLVLTEGDGWLRSQHTYADFTLHVEWKAMKARDYDAGIFFRASREGRPFPKQNYQVNLLDGKEGWVPRVAAAKVHGLVKPGEWNRFLITVVGETITLSVNGKLAYTCQGIQIPRGYLGLQCEVPKGGQFQFRNLWVIEHGYQSLFDGKTFAGWEGANAPAQKCWEISHGILSCVKPKGPWLRSVKQFGDFNFRLDYRCTPAANSGVFVRVPANGNHHRKHEQQPPAGFEVQVLDDTAKRYRKLKPYQYSASVYDIAGASPHMTRPPGQWNTLEINCIGQHVQTFHNGRQVVSVTPESHPQIRLRKLQGFLGLQNHGVGVSFRNLRIGPPIVKQAAK